MLNLNSIPVSDADEADLILLLLLFIFYLHEVPSLPVCRRSPTEMKSETFSLPVESRASFWTEQRRTMRGRRRFEGNGDGRREREMWPPSHHKGISSSATSCSGAVILKAAAEARAAPSGCTEWEGGVIGASGCFLLLRWEVSLTLYGVQLYSLINCLPARPFPLSRNAQTSIPLNGNNSVNFTWRVSRAAACGSRYNQGSKRPL